MQANLTPRCRGCGIHVDRPARHGLCAPCHGHAMLRAGAEALTQSARVRREHADVRRAVARVRGALGFLEQWERRGGTFA